MYRMLCVVINGMCINSLFMWYVSIFTPIIVHNAYKYIALPVGVGV